jgi:hypothetical protein
MFDLGTSPMRGPWPEFGSCATDKKSTFTLRTLSYEFILLLVYCMSVVDILKIYELLGVVKKRRLAE